MVIIKHAHKSKVGRERKLLKEKLKYVPLAYVYGETHIRYFQYVCSTAPTFLYCLILI